MSPRPALLILAAGASSRMRGEDKLLQRVDGVAQIARAAAAALDTGWHVLVALPPDRPDRAAALAGLAVTPVLVADAATGMAASIRAGVAAASAADAPLLMILPADMPALTGADLARVAQAATAQPDRITRAFSADGRPGHPVVFPRADFAALAALQGDEGARALLRGADAHVARIPLEGDRATLDLDTPEAWAAWLAARPSRG